MRILFIIIVSLGAISFSMFLACQPDDKVSWHSITIGNESRQAIAANQIDTTFIISSNYILKSYDSDTIGFIVYNDQGDPILFEWFEIMGTSVEFEYGKNDLPISKAHHTDVDVQFALKYEFDANNNRLYQYWIPQFGSDRTSVIDTCWFEFNKFGQLIRSRNSMVKYMYPSPYFMTEYKYGSNHRLISKTEINVTHFRKKWFRLHNPIAPRMETRYFYSGDLLDSSITEYYLQDEANTMVESLTYYKDQIPTMTVLADTIVTRYIHKKGSRQQTRL